MHQWLVGSEVKISTNTYSQNRYKTQLISPVIVSSLNLIEYIYFFTIINHIEILFFIYFTFIFIF